MESKTLTIGYINQQPRWDFRYFDDKYLQIEKLLQQSKYPIELLGKFTKQIVNFGAYSLCNILVWVDEDGIPYLRVTDLKEDGISWSNVPQIPYEVHKKLPKSKVYPGDVLYSMAGTIGLAVVAPQEISECNSNQAIAKIRLKSDCLNPYYLATFLNTQLGRYQSERIANGQTVLNINMGEIGLLRIPIPPRPIQDFIAQVMQDAYTTRRNKLAEAEYLYQTIDIYLLRELGIDITKITNQRQSIKSINSLAGGRFDFEAVVTLQEMNFGLIKPVLLQEVVRQVNQRVTPVNECAHETINYIGLSNIASNTGELVDFFPVQGKEILSSSPEFERGDILFGRMRPYLNKVWLAEFDGICSGEAVVLRPNTQKVNPVFLQALLLSQITLNQVVPLQSGTSLPRVSASDILSIKLPIPEDVNKQVEICDEISRRRNKAKTLRIEAENLVIEAKSRVERMILGEEEVT